MALADLLPIALILLALAAFVAVATVRLREQRRRATPSAPLSPVDVPPEEVELHEGMVRACLRCGATQVRPARLSEGGIPGTGEYLFWICGRCGHRGPPLEFDDATAYRQFVKGLHEEREP